MSTVRTPSGWTGWIGFAAIIMLLSGVFTVVQALAALIGPNGYFLATEGGLLFLDVNGWGWWNLVVGIVLVLTGVALFSGATWARVLGIVFVSLSAIGQLFLIPAQPWWSLIIIAVDVLVIYAITAHGRELSYRADA